MFANKSESHIAFLVDFCLFEICFFCCTTDFEPLHFLSNLFLFLSLLLLTLSYSVSFFVCFYVFRVRILFVIFLPFSVYFFLFTLQLSGFKTIYPFSTDHPLLKSYFTTETTFISWEYLLYSLFLNLGMLRLENQKALEKPEMPNK